MIENWNERLAVVVSQLRRTIIEDRGNTPSGQYNREVAIATGGLPIWSSFGGCLVITPTGSVVYYTEGEEVQEQLDTRWQRLALVVAGENYPELREIVPVRPHNAPPCDLCKGAGKCSDTICGICGGTGWLDQ